MDALPNFVKLAEAYGHVGMLIERPQDVEPALREARKLKDRTVFMDFRTDPTENVFPMVQGRHGHHRDAAGVRRPLSLGSDATGLGSQTGLHLIRIYCAPPSLRITVQRGRAAKRGVLLI